MTSRSIFSSVCATLLASTTVVMFAAQAPAPQPSTLLVGLAGCLASTGATGTASDRVTLVARDRRTQDVHISPSSGKVPTDCNTTLNGLGTSHGPVSLDWAVHVSVDGLSKGQPFFGVPVGERTGIIGGARTALSHDESRLIANEVMSSLAPEWRAPDVLVQAYVWRGAGTATELYFGIPSGTGGAVLASVRITRVFLVNGRALAADTFERTSGKEERVDTSAPVLSPTNWAVSDADATVAYLSADGGATWQRLSVSLGFEGIWWIAQALRPGVPRTFERYLYMAH